MSDLADPVLGGRAEMRDKREIAGLCVHSALSNDSFGRISKQQMVNDVDVR